MRKSGGAVIPMQQIQQNQNLNSGFSEDFKDVNFLFPSENNIEKIVFDKSFVPFKSTVCDFLNEVSQHIMREAEARQFSDVITFGFFCRRANIEQLKKSYGERLNRRLGRGVAFHIAPSNVPINFAYTLVAGLLAGNRCIVRSSSKDFPQTRLLCRIFNEVASKKDFSKMKEIFSVVMYNHSTEVTEKFSALSDIRVIWGGDNTIAEIRKAPLKPRAFDITFADRYSFAVFDAAFVRSLSDEELKKTAQNFYNDTYLYDQNACSSPRLIVWLGKEDDCVPAKEKFWSFVHANIAQKYTLEPILAVDKLTASYKSALELAGVKKEACKDNLITRLHLESLPQNITDYTCAGGCYLEYDTQNLGDIAPVVSKKFQTLSYLGMDADVLRDFVIKNGLPGIDRIVPVGKTSDFCLEWDGYDLIETMSRGVLAV